MSKRTGESMTKMFITLAVAVMLVVGLVVGAFALYEPPKEDDDLIPLIACTAEDIQKILFDSSRDTFSISQNGYSEGILQWKVDNQDNTDVDQYNVKLLVNRYNKLNARRDLGLIDTADSEQMDLYGMMNPTAEVTVTLADGERTFVIGAPYGSDYYMYEKGTGRLYVVPQTVGLYSSMSSNELRTLPGLATDIGNVGVIGLQYTGKQDIILAYIPSLLAAQRAWQLTTPMLCYTGTETMNAYLETLSGFKMSLYISPELGEDAAKYGFEDPYAQLTLAPPWVDEENKQAVEGIPTQVIVVGNPLTEVAGYRYCLSYSSVDGTTPDIKKCKVYAITDEVFDSIFGVNPIDIIDKQIVLTNITALETMDLTIGSDKYEIKVERKPVLDDDGNQVLNAEGEKEYKESFILSNGDEIKESGFRAFYTKLISLSVVAFIRDDDVHEYGEQLFSVEFHTNIKPLGQDDIEATVLISAQVYEMDSNYCAITFNGQEDIVCKIQKKQLDRITEAFQLALEGKLPGVRD